jgi:hypothetical protein
MEETINVANDECHELKTIKYKTMLLNGGVLIETKSSNDLSNLDKFLEAEKINNNNEPWCKLNKTIKTKKILEFVDVYSKKNNLEETEINLLILFLKDCLDKKKLSKVKDVVYDKENGNIKEIPSLTYTKCNKHFTLKNLDKRVSTLKSLAPKKTNGTIRKKENKLDIDKSEKNDSEKNDSEKNDSEKNDSEKNDSADEGINI